MGAAFKMKGDNFCKSNGSVLGKIKGDQICKSNGSALGKIKGDQICKTNGSAIGKIKGDKYCKTNGSVIGKMSDLIKEIDGSSNLKPELVAAIYHYHIKEIF